MNELLACVAGVLPAIVLVFYIYLLDKNQREPLPWIFKAFLYGVICAIPAILIEAGLMLLPIPQETLGRALYDAFVVAALSEESMKLLFLWLLLRKNPYFDERMDCIVYATCVSMGFAGLENVGYMLDNMDSLTDIAIRRAMLSVPGHFFNGVFMGYFMSLYYWGKPELRRRNWVLILLAPVLLHGIYDACLMSMPLSDEVMAIAVLLFLALGIYVWVGGHRRIIRVLARDKKHMDFANPLRQEGDYNKDEHSSSAEWHPVIDEEKRVAIAEAMGVLADIKGCDLGVEQEDAEVDMPRNQGIFRAPFAFHGRIRRKEYVYSYLIYWAWYRVISIVSESLDEDSSMFVVIALIVLLSFLPMMWFIIAQSCKRCHDLGHSGWWQLIPFYCFWLMFADGDTEANEYGYSPK